MHTKWLRLGGDIVAIACGLTIIGIPVAMIILQLNALIEQGEE